MHKNQAFSRSSSDGLPADQDWNTTDSKTAIKSIPLGAALIVALRRLR